MLEIKNDMNDKMKVNEILPFLNQNMIIIFEDNTGKVQKGYKLKDIPKEYQELAIKNAHISRNEFHLMIDREQWVF
jgi:hypothetical protein